MGDVFPTTVAVIIRCACVRVCDFDAKEGGPFGWSCLSLTDGFGVGVAEKFLHILSISATARVPQKRASVAGVVYLFYNRSCAFDVVAWRGGRRGLAVAVAVAHGRVKLFSFSICWGRSIISPAPKIVSAEVARSPFS